MRHRARVLHERAAIGPHRATWRLEIMRHRAGAALLAVSACAPAASPPPSTSPPAAGGGPSAAAPTSAPAPVSLRYGYAATSIVLLAQKVAVEQGIYRQHGLDVELLLRGAGVMAAA